MFDFLERWFGMAVGTDDYIVINQGVPNGKYWVNFKANKNNNPDRIQSIFDGYGNVKSLIDNLMASGYNKSQILYNGRPLTDVFHRSF